MKKTLSLLLLVLFSIGIVTAEPVGVEKARTVALNFLKMADPANTQLTQQGLVDITSTTPFHEFYVFSIMPNGFILISGDDCALPILGYSLDNPFESKDMPEHIKCWLDSYEKQIVDIKEHETPPSPEVRTLWGNLMNGNSITNLLPTAVSPLLSTTWGQSPYYNNLCPYDNTQSARTITGCTATATAQIMKYWNWPTTGRGSHSYTHSSYGTLSANFNTSYNWTNMPNSLSASSSSSQISAVATLMYHIGVAVEMNYGVNSSNAATVSYNNFNTPAAENALRTYFQYQNTLFAVFEEDFTATEWRNILINELNNSRPILYTGYGSAGGHAFVCDGYNNNGQFHFNWGWRGSQDGYFTIGSLNPGSYTFNEWTSAIIGIKPNYSTSTLSTISANANNSSYGSVFGSGTYTPYTDTVELFASANSGYKFSGWDDGCFYDPRYIIAQGGTTSLTAIFNPIQGDTIEYGNGNTGWSWGFGDSSYYVYWGIRIPSIALSAGRNLSKVQIYIPSNGTYQLQIYSGDSQPTTLLHSQPLPSVTTNTWNTVILSTPIPISGTETLWILFNCHGSEYPAALSYCGGNEDGMYWGGIDGSYWYSLLSYGNYYSWMIRAIFQPATMYSITTSSSPSAGGTTTGGGTYASGSSCTVTATPASGYAFKNWTSGGSVVSNNATYTFTVNSSRSLTANFVRRYTITATANPSNSGTVSGAGTFNSGATCTLTATPASGYTFTNWKNGSTVVSTNSTYSFTVNANRTLTANFTASTPTTYSISVSANPAAGGSVTGGGTYTQGSSCTLRAYPNANYVFTNWTSGSTVLSSNPVYTFTVNSNKTIKANFSVVTNCDIGVDDLPYTNNFDSYTTSTTAKTGVTIPCWTLAYQDVSMTDEYKPMVYYGSDYAHSGNYSLILNKRGIYAMPRVNMDLNTLQLSFYVRQTQTKYQLQVGVMTDLNDASTFEPLATFNNTSTTESVLRTISFANYKGLGHYIAFRNTLTAGNTGDYSCNYIDDITLSVNPTACIISASALPYTDNFDSYTTSTTAKTGIEPPCWTLAHQDVAMTDEYKPMVYYNAANAQSGNYSLILNKRGIYAMPYIDMDVNRLKLQFYLKQTADKYQLQVGVMSNLNDASTFVPVATLNNSSTTAKILQTVTFENYTGLGHYIAFRNTLAAGNSGDFSCNYIDNVSLSVNTAACTLSVSNLPYTDNFDSYTTSTTAKTMVEPTCWTLAHQDATMSDEYKPMIYYSSTNAHSGSYSLLLNKRGIYAMPYFNGTVKNLQLSMYVMQQQTKYQLQVGVMSNLNDPSTFVTVATINNSSTAHVLHTVSFSSYTGSGHYIAFRNTLAAGNTGDFSCNYIDDLTLSNTASYTITATANPTAGGSVSGAGTFTSGSTCTLVATPASGYAFTNWTSGSTVVSTNATYSFTVNSNRTLKANFVRTYTITASANPTAGGTVTGGGTFNSGATCTLRATAASGYVFTNWTSGSTVVSTNATYSFTVSANRTLKANFTRRYTITASANPSTGGTVTGGGTFNSGATCTLRATPNANYTFTNWTSGSTILSTNATYSFTVSANKTIKGNFTYVGDCSIDDSDLPYTDNFDSYTTSTTAKTGHTLPCWTLAHQDVTMSDEYKPMIYYGNSHSGNYSLILNKRCIYAMPRVAMDVNRLKLTFYVKQIQTKYRLQVGVMSSLTDASTFVPVATIDNSSTSESTFQTVDFSTYTGLGHHIAFRNVLAPGNSGDYSCNYIDNINLSVNSSACTLSVASLPYTENFDSYTTSTTAKTGIEPPCWNLAHQDVAMTDEYKPMIYYNASNASSGRYSLILNKRGIYTMPYFNGTIRNLQISMYVMQSQAKYQLQVGVMSNLNDASTFVPVATINNGSTSSPMLHTVSFASYTGSGHYIAFRNILAAGNSGDFSCNYIDDITLSNPTMYTITASANPSAGGTVTGAGTYTSGSSCTLRAIPNTNYTFTNWTSGSTVVSTNATYTFSVTSNRTLKANFTYNPPCQIRPTDLPYTDNFDSYTTSTTAKTGVEPTCWTLAYQDVSMTNEYKPMIYYSSSNAYSGNYSLLLNKRGIYAMPVYVGDVSTLKLSFYLKQTKSTYGLTVGVMSNLNDPTTFVPVASFNNPTITDHELAEVDFSSYTGNGRYIAFRNTNSAVNDFSCNYIDNLVLDLRHDNCGISSSDMPYTDNFDSYTTSTTAKTGVEPTCWTLVHQDVAMADEYKPMVYYSSANAHSGNYSLLLNKRGLYAMPAVDCDVSTLQISMYVKQSMAKYQLQVGVMTDINNASSFVPVTTVNNGGTSSEHVTVSFARYTGNGRYIAFRNVLASGYSGEYSCNYIDDLTLSVRCAIHNSELPWIEGFENLTTSTTAKTGVEPACWTLVHQDVSMTTEYKPMVYYEASCAHSGNYSLILNKRCLYALPTVIANVNTLQMELYVRQTQTKYQLQVGVLSNISDYSTFVPVATLDNGSNTTTSQRHVVNFSSYTGNGHYIAFRNILAPGNSGDYSCNYIDDITLRQPSAAYMDDDKSGSTLLDTPSQHRLTLYPNPTSGKLTVEADEEVVRVDVFDYTGRCIASFERQTTVDLSRLATGLYTLRVTLPERIEVRRVVKQ